MPDFTPKQIRSLFYAIEINLIFWVAVVVLVWRSCPDSWTRLVTTVGFIIAAILQHVAYYDLYKKTTGGT
jgi:hypothetical protein